MNEQKDKSNEKNDPNFIQMLNILILKISSIEDQL